MLLPWWYFAAVGFVVGACVASFGAVLVERLPARRSLLTRSTCACGRPLRAWENIPVWGYLHCRGRARCCGSSIPPWYLAFEVGNGILISACSVVGHWWGLSLSAVFSVCAYAGVGVLRRSRTR